MATIFAWDEASVSRPPILSTRFQRRLAHWNRQRLAPRLPDADWRDALERDHEMRWLEVAFLEELREAVADEAAAVPAEPDGFVAWFEGLKENGPGQGDALFPWIAEQ